MISDSDRLPVDGLTPAEQNEVDFLWSQLRRTQRRNQMRSNIYDGRRAITQVGEIIPPQYYRIGIVLGWSGKAVDMLARRCNPSRFNSVKTDATSFGLDEFIERNHLWTLIRSARLASLIHGVSFLVNTTGAGDEYGSLVHVKDALSATGRWSTRRHGLESFLSVQEWDDNFRPKTFALYVPNLTIRMTNTRDGWVITRSEHKFGLPAEAVIYKPRADRVFGSSRITRPLISLHDQGLRTVIRLEGHMDVYSYPELWMLGADMSMFKNEDGSQKANWQVMLGRIKGIPDDPEASDPKLARPDVKQFPAASPAPHLDTLEQQAMLFAGEASIPLESLGIANRANPTSAESYIASREDLISEAEGATDDWSLPVNRAVTRGLSMLNGADLTGPLSDLNIEWRSPVHVSRAAAADAGMKQLSAVPWLADTDVGLELLGLTPDQVRRALADKRRASGRSDVAALIANGGLTGQNRATLAGTRADAGNAADGQGAAAAGRPAVAGPGQVGA